MNRLSPFALAALLGTAFPALAQANPTPPPASAAPEPQPDPAVLKAMKSQVFVIKHANPIALYRVLGALGSGVQGSLISWESGRGIKAISVRDFPANLASIEAAIQRLDVPALAQQSQDVELQVQVLFASRQATADTGLPNGLASVLKGLHATLGYRSYALAATFSQRVGLNGDRAIQGRSVIEGSALGLGTAKEPHILRLDWELNQGITLQASEDGPAAFAMPRFQFLLNDRATHLDVASLDTGLALKEGEHVVVGTSTVNDHGVIVVVSAKRVP